MFDDGSCSLSLIVMVNNISLSFSISLSVECPVGQRRIQTPILSFMHFFVFRTFSLLYCHFPEAIWKFFFFFFFFFSTKQKCIWQQSFEERKKRRCVDLIDSIIFSRSTWRRSKTMLRRCTHTQEKHYRWHTHTYTHIHVIGAKEKREVGCAYSSHRQKSEKSIMLVGCVYCAMHSSFLYMCRYVYASLYWNMLLFLIYNALSARVYMPAYSCCISLS